MLLSGLGYAMTILALIFSTYYNVIITWIIYYIIKSCTTSLPWATCDNSWNTPACWIHRNQYSMQDELNMQNMTDPLDENGKYSNISSVNSSEVRLTQNGSFVWKSPADEYWQWV